MPAWLPRRAQAPLILAGSLTFALGVVAVFPLVPFGLALRTYLVALAAIASVALVRLLGEPYNRLRPRPLSIRQALDPPAAGRASWKRSSERSSSPAGAASAAATASSPSSAPWPASSSRLAWASTSTASPRGRPPSLARRPWPSPAQA
jgi:hypothetical protein